MELAQGLIGFVQYFTHVPAVLVGLHMLGACLVWLAALAVLARTLESGRSTRRPTGAPGRWPPSGAEPDRSRRQPLLCRA